MGFLENLWAKVISKIGILASFIPGIADALSMALKEGDVTKINAHLTELEEFADALKAFAATGKQAVEDGTLTLAEGSVLALELENVIEQADDIVKGKDGSAPA